MGNGEWGGNGGGNGEWGGERRTENGEWRMENGEWRESEILLLRRPTSIVVLPLLCPLQAPSFGLLGFIFFVSKCDRGRREERTGVRKEEKKKGYPESEFLAFSQWEYYFQL